VILDRHRILLVVGLVRIAEVRRRTGMPTVRGAAEWAAPPDEDVRHLRPRPGV